MKRAGKPRLHPRRRARTLAMQVLYQLDVHGEEFLREVDHFLLENEPDAQVREYARQLVKDAWSNREWIDDMIRQVCEGWDFSRIGAVERAILRLAVCEMLIRSEPPARVAMDEAIELAKTFGDRDSPAFINGLLDAVWKRFGSIKPSNNTVAG